MIYCIQGVVFASADGLGWIYNSCGDLDNISSERKFYIHVCGSILGLLEPSCSKCLRTMLLKQPHFNCTDCLNELYNNNQLQNVLNGNFIKKVSTIRKFNNNNDMSDFLNVYLNINVDKY